MARHAPIFTLLSLLLLALCSQAFMPMRPSLALSKAGAALSPRSTQPKGGRSRGVAVMDGKYWEGDWVCADCGYIYNVDVRIYV